MRIELYPDSTPTVPVSFDFSLLINRVAAKIFNNTALGTDEGNAPGQELSSAPAI
jgi:hypothetical protein